MHADIDSSPPSSLSMVRPEDVTIESSGDRGPIPWKSATMFITVAMLDFYRLTEAAGGDRELPTRSWRQEYRGLRLIITPRPAESLRYSHIVIVLGYIQCRMGRTGFRERTWKIFHGQRSLGIIDLGKIPSTQTECVLSPQVHYVQSVDG